MQAVLTGESQVKNFATSAAQADQIRPGQKVLANVLNAQAYGLVGQDQEQIEVRLCPAYLEFLQELGTVDHSPADAQGPLPGELRGIDLEPSALGRFLDLKKVVVSWNGTFLIERTPQTRVHVY